MLKYCFILIAINFYLDLYRGLYERKRKNIPYFLRISCQRLV